MLMEQLDNPISLKIYLLLKYEEFDQLVNADVDPADYPDYAANYFFDCYTAVSFVKKLPELPTTIDRTAVALEKFLEAERNCLRTNDRLGNLLVGSSRKARLTSRLLFSVCEEIKSILGPAPSFDDLQFRFGPGASSSCKGTKVTVADKLKSRPEITPLSVSLLDEVCKVDPHFAAAIYNVGGDISGPFSPLDKPNIVCFNKLSFVPKNGKTDRAICVEPTLNTYIQSGLGNAIRQRLLRSGLDLSKQHGLNAYYARLGSIDGSYATIDLSAASDSISSKLVEQIIPDDWYDLLYKSRSPWTQLPDGRLLENNKFSSMGNGFTFELESLIFLAIIRVVRHRFRDRVGKHLFSRDQFMTYGDDIIVPGPCASKTILYLNILGFKTNVDKTFITGPFRESCGKDYFNGHLVRPYFVTKLPVDIRSWYSICNGIRHLACRHSRMGYADSRFRRAWTFFRANIRKEERYYGPAFLGDEVLFAPRSLENSSLGPNGTVRVQSIVSVPDRSDQCSYRSNVVMQVMRTGYPSRTSLRRPTLKVSIEDSDFCTSLWSNLDGQWV